MSAATRMGKSCIAYGWVDAEEDVACEPPLTAEVRRSTRRRSTVSAYREGDRAIVLIPASMSAEAERQWVTELLEALSTDRRGVREIRRTVGDDELAERAKRLSERHLGGRAVPMSVRWVTNQGTSWGSCSAGPRSIRLSHRLQEMPDYVIDHVLLHELAHLLVRGHGPEFHALLESHPEGERARAFLRGFSASARIAEAA